MASKRRQRNQKHEPAGGHSAFELFRGGKGIAEQVVQRRIAELQKKRNAELEQASKTRQQMAKYFGQVQKPEPADTRATKGLDGMLGLHKKLAGQRVAVPKVARELGGIIAGGFSVRVTPPFDYDIVIPSRLAGNPAALSGSSNRTTGQMNVKCVTATQPGFNGGSMYTTVGIYFHPPTSGTLTVHATPTYSYQWWTNSLQPSSIVRSFGAGGLTVYGVDVASQTTGDTGTILSTAGATFFEWDETRTGQILLDFGFDLQAPVSVQLDVNRTLVYLLFVDANTHVQGVGWPGSLAGAEMSVTVPSITYEFQARQVLAPP